MDTLYRRATRLGKEAKYIVHFRDVGLTLEGTLVREELE